MLKFKVQNQTLTRTDSFAPVADSKNYLTAEFEFSDEWTENISVVFTYDGNGYVIQPTEEKCTVPWEVIKAPGFYVSLFCGDLITTNNVYVEIKESGMLDGEVPGTPTPTLWQKYIAELADKNSELLDDKLDGAVSEAKVYAETTAETAEENAKGYADTKMGKAEASLKEYADSAADTAETASKSYTDEKIASSEIGKLADGAVSKAKLDNALKSEIDGKADGYALSTSITGNTLLLADKTETQLISAAVTTLTLTLPETIPAAYECFFSFKSGATATSITSPNNIRWAGADCNASKQLVPMPDTVYEVGIRRIGTDADGNAVICARVGAC